MGSSQMSTARDAMSLPQDADAIRTHPPKLNGAEKEGVRRQTASQAVRRRNRTDNLTQRNAWNFSNRDCRKFMHPISLPLPPHRVP